MAQLYTQAMFLNVERLQVHYPGRAQAAVNQVSLHLQPGEMGVLIGPSGCGKTTLLRAIAGLEPVSGGESQLAHQVISSVHTQVPPEARRMGMVFQDYALFPHLNVQDNIGFGLRHLPTAEKKARIEEVLELVA